MNCKDIDFTALAKRELDEGERLASETHIADCEVCEAELEKTKSVLALLASAPRLEAPADFPARVEAALLKAHPELGEPPLTFREFVRTTVGRSRQTVPAWALSFAIHLIIFGVLAIVFWNTATKEKGDAVFLVNLPKDHSYPAGVVNNKDIDSGTGAGTGQGRSVGTGSGSGTPDYRPPDWDLPEKDSIRGSGQEMSKGVRPEYVPDEEIKKTYKMSILLEDPVAALVEGGRRGAGRVKLDTVYDKDHAVAKAITKSLAWLSARQLPNGSFPVETAVQKEFESGVTSLCLLAFLADGHTHQTGKYKDVVRRGVDLLLKSQDKQGRLGVRSEDNFMYNHALGTIVLLESLLMTNDTALLENAAKLAVAYIVAAQSSNGGWGYVYQSAIPDVSVTVWQLQALRLARGAGLKTLVVPALVKAKHAIELWTDEAGRVGYRSKGAFPHGHEALTAMGLVAHLLSSVQPDEELVSTQAALVGASARFETSPEKYLDNDLTCLYFGSFGLFQIGGDRWTSWHSKIRAELLKMQISDGGYPAKLDRWSGHGGQCYETAMATLILETYLRIPTR